MALFGTIAHYDRLTGSGFIRPDTGGEGLPFGHGDLEGSAALAVPLTSDRFAFDMGNDAAGESCAINLRRA